MLINKKTKIIFSASSNPGNFGATLYNTIFKRKKMNIIYLPQKFNNAKQIYRAISNTNTLGCSVSMPFKEKILKFIKPANSFTKKIGSINTIIVKDNFLRGYNTDALGALDILKNKKFKNVLIIGNGGVSKALIIILKKLKKIIFITGRNKLKIKKLKNKYRVNLFINNKTKNIDMVINATPIYKKKSLFNLVSENTCKKIKYFFDLNVSLEENELIRYFKNLKIKTISGFEMYINQVRHQFLLYTKKSISLNEIKNVFKVNYKRLIKKL